MDEKEKDLKEKVNAETEGATNTEETAAQPAEEAEATAEAPAEEAPQAEENPLEALEEKLKEQEDKNLRLRAEFENFRKRTIKEKAELIINGAEKTVQAMLPVVDDMERALDNAQKSDDVEALREGMDLIYKKLMKALEGLGVKPIDAVGKEFDVDFHEAIAMVPGMGDDKKGKVIDCVQTGYTINDKVIRHAKVAVGQ
jgi:molecular chaperone GrpE